MKILWKEWHQQKRLILAGSLAGITLPIFEWFNNRQFNPQINNTETGSIAVLACGALFAIILSAASSHHDLKKGIDNFWQSKPLKTRKLFITKLLLASVMIFFAFLFVQSIDFITHSRQGYFPALARAVLAYTYPIALVMFSLTIFLMVIVRDVAKTVLLAIWAALLIYFLPLLTNTLQWLNFFKVIDQPSRTPSIIDYFVWLTLLPSKIDCGVSIARPAWMPHNFYQITDAELEVNNIRNLWYIVISPEYLRYLLFVTLAIITSATSIFLAVKAVKNNWRWQPGQKTIAWALGLSAAFIFGIAITQVGHNLVPIRSSDGQDVDYLMNLDAKPEHLYDWVIRKDKSDIILDPTYAWANTQLCVDENYMYKISNLVKSRSGKAPVTRDWFIDTYQQPSTESSGKHLAKIRFFSTPPAAPNHHQNMLANFIKDKKLYIAYQPRLELDEGVRNPLRFLVADITVPKMPKLLFDQIIYEPKGTGTRTKGSQSNLGNYCYIAFNNELVIISVAEENNPKVVNAINRNELGLDKDSYIPSHGLSVVSDKEIICFDYYKIMLLNIGNPIEPKKVFCHNFEPLETSLDRGDTIGAATYYDEKIYISRESGIYIYQVAVADDQMHSKMIGYRKSTPLERMSHRIPLQLLIHNNMLIEAASSLGIIVYDISDPTRPRRIYHGGDGRYISAIGFWNGIFYGGNPHHTVRGYLNFFNLPNLEKDTKK